MPRSGDQIFGRRYIPCNALSLFGLLCLSVSSFSKFPLSRSLRGCSDGQPCDLLTTNIVRMTVLSFSDCEVTPWCCRPLLFSKMATMKSASIFDSAQ